MRITMTERRILTSNLLSASPAMVFTGRRHDDHFRIDVDEHMVLLPGASLGALVELVIACIQTESGLIRIPKLVICRLRKAINEQAGAGVGKRLIETGCKEEYRVAIAKNETAERIGIAACFYELVALQILSQDHANLLRKWCRPVTLDETERKPARNRQETKRKPARNQKETKRKPTSR